MAQLDVATFCSYNGDMDFKWDEVKRRTNLRKHGFVFADAELVFAGDIVTMQDNREEYSEARFITVSRYA